ncbi:MAG: tetratricopeptide repeat protein [bacterium]
MTKKLALLFAFSIFVCIPSAQVSAGTNSKKALDAIIKSVNKYLSPDFAINEQTISETITKFEKLSSEKIKPPKSKDFEQLQKKTRKLGNSLIELSKRFETEKDNINFIISLCNVYFQTLHKIQSKIQDTYDQFRWQDKLTNSLPFAQSRTALNHAKTTLFLIITKAYSKINNSSDKRSFWLIVDKMVDSTNIVITEIGPVKSEFHSLVILLKLIKITENIELIYANEFEKEVKSFSADTIEKIRAKQVQFKEQVEEVKKRGREFAAHFATAQDYAGVKEPVDYEEIKSALTANEWFQKGYNTEDCQEKIKYFTKALEIEPSFLPAYINRGVCYDNLKQYENAIRDYTSALKIDPRYLLVYNYRGMSYSSLDKYEEAIKDYNKAIEIDPLLILSYVNRGVTFRQMGKYEQAIQDYSKAIELDPNNAQIYCRRGTCFTNLKKFNLAIQDFLKAIEILPDYTLAYYNLGYAYWGLKKWNEVVKAWQKCLELEPEQPQLLKHLRYARRKARYTRLKNSIK